MNANRNLFPSNSLRTLCGAHRAAARGRCCPICRSGFALRPADTQRMRTHATTRLSPLRRIAPPRADPLQNPNLSAWFFRCHTRRFRAAWRNQRHMKVRVLIFSSLMLSFCSHGDFLQNTVNSQRIGAGHLRVFLQARVVTGLQRHKSLFSSRAC